MREFNELVVFMKQLQHREFEIIFILFATRLLDIADNPIVYRIATGMIQVGRRLLADMRLPAPIPSWWANLLMSIVTALIFQISPETFGHWGPAAALFLAANLGMAPLQLFPLSPDRDGAAIIRYGILLLTKRPDYSLWADLPAPDNPPHDTDETSSRPSGEANDQNHFSNAPTLRAA